MSLVRIEEQLMRARAARVRRADTTDRRSIGWQNIDAELQNDTLFGGKDWNELAVLLDNGTPLGRAVRRAQKYFADDEIVSALKGESREVALVVIDGSPAFVNAAMLAEALTGAQLEPVAA